MAGTFYWILDIIIDMNLSKLWEIVEDRGAWPSIIHTAANSQTRLSEHVDI